MRLILIRHGQTEWNLQRRIQGWKDSSLTPQAITQLRAIEFPQLINPALFSSDLGRAYQSAQILAERVGICVQPDKRLRERKFGVLEGQVIDQDDHLADYWSAYHKRYSEKMTSVFGVEPEGDFEKRIQSFLSELERTELDRDVVIVSHGEWLRALCNILQGIPSWHSGSGIISNGAPLVIERHATSQLAYC